MAKVHVDSLKVLVINRYAIMRMGLRQIITEIGARDLRVHEAESLAVAARIIAENPAIDLIITDPSLPDVTSGEFVRSLKEMAPDVPAIFLVDQAQAHTIPQIIGLGACGLLLNCCASKELFGAILILMAGGTYISPRCMQILESRPRSKQGAAVPNGDRSRPGETQKDVSALTSRQREVLYLVREGRSNKEICRKIGVSPGTVKNHVSSILRQLGVKNRTQAASL